MASLEELLERAEAGESLADLDETVQAEALMAELESASSNDTQSPIVQGVGNAVSNVAAIPSAIGSLAESFQAENPQTGLPFVDVPSALGGMALNYAKQTGAEGTLRGIARTGAEVAAGLAPLALGPVGAVASPGTSAIAGTAMDALTGAITGDPGPEDGYMREAGRRVGEYYTLAGLGAGASKLPLRRPLKRGQIQNDAAMATLATQDPGGRMASELGFNRGGISQANQAMAKRVSEDIVDAVDSGVLDGRKVDPATGRVVADRPASTVKEALDNVRAVQTDAITQFNTAIDDLQTVRDTFNAANPQSRLKGVVLDQDDIASLNEAVEKFKVSPGGSERVDLFKKDVAEMQRTIKEVGLEAQDPAIGTWEEIVKAPEGELNLKQVTQALRGINEQRRLNGKFELAVEVADVRGDAGLLAKVRAQNEFLDAIYPVLQKKQGELIADTLRVAPTVASDIGTDIMKRVTRVTPESMAKMNSLYGKMSTAEMALERAQAQVNSFANTPPPNSLIKTMQSGGPKSGVVNRLGGFVADKAAEYGIINDVNSQALNYSKGVVEKLRTTARLAKQPVPQVPPRFNPRTSQQLGMAGQTAIQVAKLPRSVENFFALPTEMMPPEILEDPEARALIEEAQNSTDDVRASAMSKIIANHRFLFEEEPVRGFDMVMEADGQYRIRDPLKRQSYADHLRKTEKSKLALAEKLTALNKDGVVLGVERPLPKTTIEAPKPNASQVIDGAVTSKYNF